MCIISCSFLALQFINIFNLQSICQSSLFMADHLCVASLYFFSYSIIERSTFWNKLDSYLQLCTLPKVNIYAVDILPIQIGFALKRGLANMKRIIFIVIICKLCNKVKMRTAIRVAPTGIFDIFDVTERILQIKTRIEILSGTILF